MCCAGGAEDIKSVLCDGQFGIYHGPGVDLTQPGHEYTCLLDGEKGVVASVQYEEWRCVCADVSKG